MSNPTPEALAAANNFYVCKVCHKPCERRKPCARIHELDGMCSICWRGLQDEKNPVVVSKCDDSDGIWATATDIKIAGLERDLETAQTERSAILAERDQLKQERDGLREDILARVAYDDALGEWQCAQDRYKCHAPEWTAAQKKHDAAWKRKFDSRNALAALTQPTAGKSEHNL